MVIAVKRQIPKSLTLRHPPFRGLSRRCPSLESRASILLLRCKCWRRAQGNKYGDINASTRHELEWARYLKCETERVATAVALSTRIREVLSSNLGRDTSNPDLRFALFSSVSLPNLGIESRLGQHRFLPNPFQFISHPTLYKCGC
jgi:hypothetical protein